MPRDSLADSSRTMINHGRRETRRPRTKRNHIGPIDPHAFKIPARRAESLFGEIHPHLHAEPKQTHSASTQDAPKSSNHLDCGRINAPPGNRGQFTPCGLRLVGLITFHDPSRPGSQTRTLCIVPNVWIADHTRSG